MTMKTELMITVWEREKENLYLSVCERVRVRRLFVVVAGLVHSVSSPLYSLGSRVSEGVRQFVETGATDKMEMETVNKTFLDAVLAPPILTGVGQTNTTIFVDSNHTKVEH